MQAPRLLSLILATSPIFAANVDFGPRNPPHPIRRLLPVPLSRQVRPHCRPPPRHPRKCIRPTQGMLRYNSKPFTQFTCHAPIKTRYNHGWVLWRLASGKKEMFNGLYGSIVSAQAGSDKGDRYSWLESATAVFATLTISIAGFRSGRESDDRFQMPSLHLDVRR